MNPINLQFDGYRLQYYSNQAYITCLKGAQPLGTLCFHPDGTTLPPNKGWDDGVLVLNYYLSQFNDVIGILRYEKPLVLWFNPDNGMGALTTGPEPVGEQEGLAERRRVGP